MPTEQKKIACLLIHGFSAHRSSLEAVIPELDKQHIPWHYPILSGHGTRASDLKSVTWDDWKKDVENAYGYLRQEYETVVVIAHSMGALLALELAARHAEHCVGLVLLAPALRFKIPFARHTSRIAKLLPWVINPSITKINSWRLLKRDLGYRIISTRAFAQYWQRTHQFDDILQQVRQPARIIHSKKDKMADPAGSQHIYDTIPSQHKELVWLERSGHEILLDLETDTVLEEIFKFPLLRE